MKFFRKLNFDLRLRTTFMVNSPEFNYGNGVSAEKGGLNILMGF